MTKYERWYHAIIERAQNRVIEGYTEKHHIVPRSFGGSDMNINLVALTAREHFICHLLLVKMNTGEFRFKMLCALMRFTYEGKRKSRLYKMYKEQAVQLLKERWAGEGNPNFGGKLQTPEVKAKMRGKRKDSSKMGRWKRSQEFRDSFSELRKGKGCGERNSMADPEKRKLVGISKLGKRKYMKDGVGKMFLKDQQPEGWSLP